MSVSVNDKNIGHVTAYAYAKAKGYTGTEEEFAQLMADYGSVAQAAAQSASEAAQSASEAAQSAQDAAGSSTEATAAKTAAETARTDAQAARDGAQTAEAGAQAARTAAETAQSRAESARTGAETARTQAAGSAEAASTSANNASASETAAAASATAAQTAQTGAETAKTAAETAQGKAETAAGSIEESVEQIATNTADIAALKSDYPQTKAAAYAAYVTDTVQGEITSFPDGADNVPVKSLTVNVEPVQDLHGQESPYPAGGGKNLFNNDTELISVVDYGASSRNGYRMLIKPGAYALSVAYNTAEKPTSYYIYGKVMSLDLNTEIAQVNLVTGANYTNRKFEITEDAYLFIYDGIQTNTISASKTAFAKFNIQLERGTEQTSFAPYSNICPISGHTQAAVTRCGKNLLNRDTEENGYINTNGGIQTDGVSIHSALMIVTEGDKYTFSGKVPATSTSGNKRVHGYDANGNWVSQLGYQSVASGGSYAVTVTIPNGIKYVKVSHFSAETECQFEKAETATAYEPYQGQTVTVDLDGTIYGGTLDVGTGVLTVDRQIVDLGTLSYSRQSESGKIDRYLTTGISALIKKTSDIAMTNIISSMFVADADPVYGRQVDNSVCVLSSNGYMYICASGFSDAASFKAVVTGQTLVYELADPFTVQLTANDIKTLLGTNNIWSDAGDVDVTYRADTRLYIDKRINEAVSALS